MITKGLIDRLFDAASIQRWNDHPRPVELTELDKQAHKAVIAWVLAKFEEDRGATIDWRTLIEAFFAEYLPRVVLTDIKAPVFHRLMERNGPQIRRHVEVALRDDLAPLPDGFHIRFLGHLHDPEDATLERRILSAAHYLATRWEFTMIESAAPWMYGIEGTRSALDNQIEDFVDLLGVQKIALRRKAHGFVDLAGQLRFQIRWAQTPRIPRTSVLGHSVFVAMLAYLLGLEAGIRSPRRLANDFLCALFHDLPEVLTRDIVSPVKRGVEGLEEAVAAIEDEMVESIIMPLLTPSWRGEMRFFLRDVMTVRVRREGIASPATIEELNTAEAAGESPDAVDGTLVKACDDFAAYVEACASLAHGVRSRQIEEAVEKKFETCAGVVLGTTPMRPLYDYFR
jgi:putative hydrolase of HD superfamily